MAKNIKKIGALLLAGLMALSLCACQGKEEDPANVIPTGSSGTEVSRSAAADEVFSLNSNSNYSFNPLIATNHANQLICCLVYENMVELDDNFNVLPNVITEWKCSEDGKSWEFTVGSGHYFHDGSQVTAKDLSYSLSLAINADRYKGRFSSFQGASFTEDKLQVSLGIGDGQFVKLLNIPIVKSGTYQDPRPIGSGPYTYNEDNTALVAFEQYHSYDTLPVDTIYIKDYQAADGIISAFEDSVIDVVLNDPSSYTNLGYSSTNETHSFATTNMHYVAFNENSVLGKMAQFRVAMQYAFDREYLEELLKGNAVASSVPMYPSCEIYPQSIADKYSYDLETCKSILDAGGIRDYDEDGRLEYMSGSPQTIDVSFIVSSDSSAKSGVARRFAESMNSIGLNVTVRELTWSEYTKALEEGDFDMYYGEVKLRNNFDLTELLQVRSEDNETTNINYTNSKDSSVETYINDYLASGDTGRSFAFQNLVEYINGTTGSLITIGFEKQQIISHRGVIKGLDPNAGNPLFNVENWVVTLTDE